MSRFDGQEAEQSGLEEDVVDGSDDRSGFPAASLVVLVGASSAGKTTWASSTFRENEIVSLSRLKAAVGTGAHDVQAIPAAYRLMNQIVSARIKRGLRVVVDSDGIDSGKRNDWAAEAASQSMPAYAILFATDLEICLVRNARRKHPLPEAVVRRQVMRCLEIGPDLEKEGFAVLVLRTPSRETREAGPDAQSG